MDLDTLYEYREIRPSDYHVIKELHEEFFPVRYLDQFYEDVVEGKGIGGDDLCTIVVTTKAREYKGRQTKTNEGKGGQGQAREGRVPESAEADPWEMDAKRPHPRGCECPFCSPRTNLYPMEWSGWPRALPGAEFSPPLIA